MSVEKKEAAENQLLPFDPDSFGGTLEQEKVKQRREKGSSTIYLYPDGMFFNAPAVTLKKGAWLDGVKRGKVSGWSKSSRKRMRKFLMLYRPPRDWVTYNCTFTVPGPVVDPMSAKVASEGFLRAVRMRGWCAVWRLEIQKRGALHWHCILSAPEMGLESVIENLWHRMIDKMGPVSGVYTRTVKAMWWMSFEDKVWKQNSWAKHYKSLELHCESRMEWPGAKKYSALIVCQGVDNGGAVWKRYLCDHASKSKQEQIAVGMGRHWGVVGRKNYVQVDCDGEIVLNSEEAVRFLRVAHRLTRTSRKAGCVFGRKLGYNPTWGHWGESTRNMRPDTIRRIVEWSRNAVPIIHQ